MSKLPSRIGKYKIRSSLGEGAMGVVYEGFDPDIERRVAIKILHQHLITEKNGEEFLERFKREAMSAARCTHQNVVTVLEYGQDGIVPYIVMEFVEGASLQEIIKRGKAISLQKTLSVISQLLKALHYAHRLKIIHRDIKSANVMILKDGGDVKLADFGIARIAESPDLTMTGAVVGTPKYMAPEQMFGLEVDQCADLFSVTMVFVELLTLMPKNNGIPKSSLPEIANLPPNNRIDYSILYPTALIPVLVKGLSAKKEERYQSAKEYVQAIKAVLPRIKSNVPAGSEDDESTAIVQQSSQQYSVDKVDLDSMTSLLVDYLGPIAKNIMGSQDTQNTSIDELATTLSREIPEPKEREAFLKRWESMSGTRIDATKINQSTSHSGLTSPGVVFSVDDETLQKISEDYASYIGPLAARLVRHYSTSAQNMNQFLELLAGEIPDTDESRKFIHTWNRG